MMMMMMMMILIMRGTKKGAKVWMDFYVYIFFKY